MKIIIIIVPLLGIIILLRFFITYNGETWRAVILSFVSLKC